MTASSVNSAIREAAVPPIWFITILALRSPKNGGR
jgi:hypothetical protein